MYNLDRKQDSQEKVVVELSKTDVSMSENVFDLNLDLEC